ncbi:MAG: penicillin-resistant DD-carboxypeptidase [Cyanobacteria bacterium RYN_339]|nr:penicillin-resistant DD-carboxypeptidase [Cyanobacteria bacterium RYN_339]
MTEVNSTRIATLGSYAAAKGRMAAQRRATAPVAPIVPSRIPAAGQVPTAAPILSVPRTTAAPTLDDIEGKNPTGTLPTDSEAWGGPTTAAIAGGARMHINTVTDLQHALRSAGFDPGPIDGQMGPRTDAAIRAFQHSRGLKVDGAAGRRTLAALGSSDDDAPAAPVSDTPSPVRVGALQGRLTANLHNRYKGRVHQCFRYAWATTAGAGGRGIGSATTSHAGRNAGVGHLDSLIDQGQVVPGDVIYVNKRPGADPSSTHLVYGPHWFVYLGNRRFADQYGVRDAQAMQNFVPGRRIDTIYHPYTQQA